MRCTLLSLSSTLYIVFYISTLYTCHCSIVIVFVTGKRGTFTEPLISKRTSHQQGPGYGIYCASITSSTPNGPYGRFVVAAASAVVVEVSIISNYDMVNYGSSISCYPCRFFNYTMLIVPFHKLGNTECFTTRDTVIKIPTRRKRKKREKEKKGEENE